MGTHTPWGVSDSATMLAPGIISYGTPSHGGIHICARLNTQIHIAWRNKDGWYEEDCDWAIVAFHFPEAFNTTDIATAITTLKNWKPHAYMIVRDIKLELSDSHILREEAWKATHSKQLQAVAAWDDWHKAVPKEMVIVCACIGGYTADGRYAGQLRYFLVPKTEYTIPFAFDEVQYQETGPII